MAYFALLWKARTIEKYRSNYEKEKINSIIAANAELPRRTISQKWKLYRYNSQKKICRTFRKWCPEGSKVSNFFVYLTTDQTFANFLVKSVIGFVGGIVLTYFWFMFFVFQLSISLIHATIMSSFIGVLLTLGLAFSYRIRCLVFLLIPQFFSRVGRYTLTCYALVLILTGPATNTLKNSEVLSESLACGQEQVKSNVNKISEAIDKPLQLLKETINSTMKKIKSLAAKVKEVMVNTHRMIMSIAHVLQSTLAWLTSVEAICNSDLGTPYEHCVRVLGQGHQDCKKLPRKKCNIDYLIQAVCINVKPINSMCVVGDFARSSIVATVKKKLEDYSNRIKSLLSVALHVKRSHACYSNVSRSASQAAAGIVTEIRHRADPLLTWLSWSSYLTSLFLLLIIFRAKYYQQMFETRSRFDNRYVTKELRDLDFLRLRQGRETVLPLNTRERAKYVSTSSFRLLASERVHLSRSIVFMVITTFKLSIHMVADYSLYWVLMNMRFHGRFQALAQPGDPTAGISVSGSGPLGGILRGLLEALSIPLALPPHSPITCLPNPHPPDFQRYTQIGVLIILLWVFALFEPYGLRLRHVIMNHYQPERARARAEWLYNHIIRTRGCFLKYARRKLHREYKYSTEQRLTFRNWLHNVIPCRCLRYLFGVGPEEPRCLLCSIKHIDNDPDTYLKRCESPSCPGVYCARCFMDIGQLCTICLSPKDYGDLSDMSLEKSSSDESDNDAFDDNPNDLNKPLLKHSDLETDVGASTSQKKFTKKGFQVFSRTKNKNNNEESMPLLNSNNFKRKNDCVLTQPLKKRLETEKNDNDCNKAPGTAQSRGISNKPKIPVVVRDKKRMLKSIEVPKENLPGIINTMTLLTTKLYDEKFNKNWHTHDSKTFEYLVMEFFQPVDIFKKALLVRHAKYAENQLNLNNDEKINSLKEVISFLCSYQMNDDSSNNGANDKTKTALHSNQFAITEISSNKNHNDNAPIFNDKISDRNLKNIRYFQRLRQTVLGDLFIRLNKRKINFKTDKYVSKKRKRFALTRKYISITGIKQLDYKCPKNNIDTSVHDLAKCRIYEINKETFAKNLRIKMTKITRQKKKVTRKTKCLAIEKKLSEQVRQCSTNDNVTQKCSNVVTDCSSNIKQSDLKYVPDSVKEAQEIKTNVSKDKNVLMTNDNNINSNKKKIRIGGYCSCIWKQTKLNLKLPKLAIGSTNKKPYANNKANHKRRKKSKISDEEANNTAKLKAKEVNDDARNFRISLYLKEYDWFKKGDLLNRKTTCKTDVKLSKKEVRSKIKEEKALKKAAMKQLIQQLKLKSKEDQKMKKQARKEKRDPGIINTSQTIKKEAISCKQTPKNNTKSRGKVTSVAASSNFAKKLITNVSKEMAVKNQLKNARPRRNLPRYLDFYEFTCPSFDMHQSSLDLDDIFSERLVWNAECGETKVYCQEDKSRLCEEFFWPYCRKTNEYTQTIEEEKNEENKVNINDKLPDCEECEEDNLKSKVASVTPVDTDVSVGVKKSVEKICSFQAPPPAQKDLAEKEVDVSPDMKSCSCQNVDVEKSSKQTQAQVNVKHCDTQCEPKKSSFFTTNVNKKNDTMPCTYCTCAAQSLFPGNGENTKVSVGTIHHNAIKKMHHASVQWERQELAPMKGSDNIEESSASDSTLFDKDIYISEGTKTDTTICSRLNFDVGCNNSKMPKFKVKVVTKSNQSTATEKLRVTDVSTTTIDWWSPLVERKNKRKFKNVNKRDDGDKNTIGITTDGKFVSFKSYAQIIPAEHADILSPSRYLLESQKYYNELFVPGSTDTAQDQCPEATEKAKSAPGLYRMHKVNKTKRLEDTYSHQKKMQTSVHEHMNMTPVSWLPAKKEDMSLHSLRHHQRRNAKLQATLKSKDHHETNINRGIHIKVRNNEKATKLVRITQGQHRLSPPAVPPK